jgi:hypothetical protein
MDLRWTPPRISCMSAPAWRKFSAMLLAAAMLVTVTALRAEPAGAAVGVEKVSRLAGVPGDPVGLTLACGFCFPPCHGAPGHRNVPCMLGTKAQPPKEFPISLVPIEKAPKLHRCGPNAVCPPLPRGAPRHAPYAYLGRATPPADDESPASGNYVPRYLIHFDIPDLRPGVYTYAIFCDVCAPGKRGSLIANPRDRRWRLRVQQPPAATFKVSSLRPSS